MLEHDRLPNVRLVIPDDAVDENFYRPSAAPFPLPDESLSQELPIEPAPYPPDDIDRPLDPDEVEPY